MEIENTKVITKIMNAMETQLNDGLCPECLLQEEEIKLQLNKDDFWECPKSHLQLAVNGINAVILKFRAFGQFKDTPVYGTDKINGAILTRAEADSIFSDESLFNSRSELKEYLNNEVEPPLEFNLENLVKTYLNFKYGNLYNYEYPRFLYKRQSKYFKIDFDNTAIIKKLEKRDTEENVSYARSYKHLHRLLSDLLPRYPKGDLSWLPAMGMSQIELDFCLKTLPCN